MVYWRNGIRERDYFHPGCFPAFISALEAMKDV